MTENLKSMRVSKAVMLDGTVFLAATESLEGKNVFVVAGDTEYTLEAVSDGAIDSMNFLDPLPRNIEVAGDPGDWPIQKNGLDEWQVAEWTSLRIAMSSENPILLPIKSDLRFDPQGHPFQVEARLAVHRGSGKLIVTAQNPLGQVIREQVVVFDTSFTGGASKEGYQKAVVSFAGLSGEVSIKLAVECAARLVPGDGNHPVFFVAQPQVIVAQPGSTLPVPRVIHLDETEVATFWHKAEIGLNDRMNGVPVALVGNGARINLMPAKGATLQLTANWGHFLEFDASAGLRGIVYVNGEAAFHILFSAGNNPLRMPERYLRGEYLHLEIRDESGFQVLWHDWILVPRQLTSLDHLQRESRSPYPVDLYPQSPSRFSSLRAHCDAGIDADGARQVSIAIKALEAGYESLKMTPLAFPHVENPDVSVVIPAHNKVKVSYACMCALLLAYNKASFEVILVDDGSSDETTAFEEIVSGITVVHNVDAQRFIRACNAGADVARGKYVVLLNNDTEPTNGWLDALIDAFERFDNVGLVGSKLLYPDGRLQDAGGIIWGTGDPWNYGRLQNPADPRYSYARQADYLSGAALMTSKAIWDEVGGLSRYLEPMYFEDTDFAFKIRDHGYTTWFIPASVVYHYEGVTSGTDTSKGFKRFQEVNRPKFKRQWVNAYANHSPVGQKPDLEKDRGIVGRVLFIDYTTPTPDRDAGGYAALQEIKLVQSLGYKVTFLPENLAYMGSYTTDLEAQGVEMITAPFYTSVRQFLEERAREFDAFYITRYHVVNSTVRIIRELVPSAKVIMNGADLHYLRLLRRGIVEKNAIAIDEARGIRDDELKAMRSVDLVLSYNDTEIAIVEAMSEGTVTMQKCPWVLDLPETTSPSWNARKGISFLGSFQHHPNAEGMEWFASSVMKDLAFSRPDIVLSIYGSRLNERIKALSSPTILPIGYVEEVADAYDPHRIFVAPLLSGAGIKGKVLSAIAHGIPCVLSSIAAEGTGLRDGSDCFIADTPAEWVEKIGVLYDDVNLWEKFRQNGLDLARNRYSFERGREQMRAAFEAVDLFRSRV